MNATIAILEKEIHIETQICQGLQKLQSAALADSPETSSTSVDAQLERSILRLDSLRADIQKRKNRIESLTMTRTTSSGSKTDLVEADQSVERVEEIMEEIINSELRYYEDMKLVVKVSRYLDSYN